MNIPLHCLAYILVPKYYTSVWLSKPAPGGQKRKKPHFDAEVQKGYLEAIDKMVVDPREASLLRLQISDFVSNKGVFAQPQAVRDRATMSALQWWHMYGGGAPELYSLAIRVLSQGVNTSSAERCWSTYSYIHSAKRNRLNNDRAEKLVFVHYNHRLLSRYRDDYESFKNWDIYDEEANTGEAFETMEEREQVVLSDSEDEIQAITNTPAPPTPPTPSSTSSAIVTSLGPSPTVPSSTDKAMQAQRRIEKARRKKQKK